MSFDLRLDPVLQLTLRLALALVFWRALQHKLRDFPEFRRAVENYRLLPLRLVGFCAVGVAALEIGVGLGLLVPGLRQVAALAAVGLLGLYSGAIVVNLVRGRRAIDCGCGGPGAHISLSEGLVVRNSLLVLAALACTLPDSGRALVWLDAATASAGLLGLTLVFLAVENTLENAPRLRALRKGRAWSTR